MTPAQERAIARRRLRPKVEKYRHLATGGGLPDCWVQIIRDALLLAGHEIDKFDKERRR